MSFDINVKMPRTISYLEENIKKQISEKIKRGKVDVFVTFENYSSQGTTIRINRELAKEYINPDSPKYKLMVDEICRRMNFDTLKYHRIDDLIDSIGIEPCKLCTYCFDGKEE